jgi:hypothetical protein
LRSGGASLGLPPHFQSILHFGDALDFLGSELNHLLFFFRGDIALQDDFPVLGSDPHIAHGFRIDSYHRLSGGWRGAELRADFGAKSFVERLLWHSLGGVFTPVAFKSEPIFGAWGPLDIEERSRLVGSLVRESVVVLVETDPPKARGRGEKSGGGVKRPRSSPISPEAGPPIPRSQSRESLMLLSRRMVGNVERNGSMAPDVAFGVSMLVRGGLIVVAPGSGDVRGEVIESFGIAGFRSEGC